MILKVLNCLKVSVWGLIYLYTANSTYTFPVPPGDGLYPFLRIMCLEEKVKNCYNQIPWQWSQVEQALDEISENSLNAQQKTQLQFYQKKYSKKNSLPYTSYHDKSKRYLRLTPELYGLGSYSDSINQGQETEANLKAFSTLRLQIHGQLNPYLTFYSQVFLGQAVSNQKQYYENYNSRYGQPYNSPDKARSSQTAFPKNSFDGVLMGLSFQGNWGILSLTHDWNEWGPGIWQHPSISSQGHLWVDDPRPLRVDSIYPSRIQRAREGFRTPGESAPLTQIRWQYRLPFAQYTKWIGKRVGLSYDSLAYVTGQRLEFNFSQLNIGFHEILTLSGRDFEPSYLPPFAPFFIMEHFTGDLDNNALGFDVSYTFPQNFRLYFDLFLDDLVSPTSLFKNFWGNKYSLNLGVEGTSKLWPLEYRAEYSRVEPWLFTHHMPLHYPNSQLQHLGSLLGSNLPANSHRFKTQFFWNQFKNWKPGMMYTFSQRQYFDPGSHVLDNHQATDKKTKNFLGENPETRHSLEGSIHAWIYKIVQLEINTGIDLAKRSPNLGDTKELEMFPHVSGEVNVSY